MEKVLAPGPELAPLLFLPWGNEPEIKGNGRMGRDRLINRQTRKKRDREIHSQIRVIQTGSTRKRKREKVFRDSLRPSGLVRGGETGGGSNGKLCVYVLQEEA